MIAHPALKYFCAYDGSHIGRHFLDVILAVSPERLVMFFVKMLNSLR